jgi:hypothetical protein
MTSISPRVLRQTCYKSAHKLRFIIFSVFAVISVVSPSSASSSYPCSDTGAIILVERKQVPSTPATILEMGSKVLQEKGRLVAFLKIMQS